MTIPLAILAILSVIGGFFGIPAALGGSNRFEHFLDPVFMSGIGQEIAPDRVTHGTELTLAFISVAVALLGLAVAYLWYVKNPGTASRLANSAKPLYNLLDHKYWVDEAYGLAFVMPLLMFTRAIFGGLVEGLFVQGSGAGLAAGTQGLGWLTRRMQSGNIRSYAGWLAFGAAILIAVVLFGIHPVVR